MCKNENCGICATCNICIFGCKHDMPSNGVCPNFMAGMSLKEINRELKEQNVNLRKLAKRYYLKYDKLMLMLKGKAPLHYKYRMAIMREIEEKPTYAEYLERFEDGEEK